MFKSELDAVAISQQRYPARERVFREQISAWLKNFHTQSQHIDGQTEAQTLANTLVNIFEQHYLTESTVHSLSRICNNIVEAARISGITLQGDTILPMLAVILQRKYENKQLHSNYLQIAMSIIDEGVQQLSQLTNNNIIQPDKNYINLLEC